jgi:hypothetical protein
MLDQDAVVPALNDRRHHTIAPIGDRRSRREQLKLRNTPRNAGLETLTIQRPALHDSSTSVSAGLLRRRLHVAHWSRRY